MAKRVVSQQTRERMSKAQRNRQLTRKQEAFVKQYAKLGNGTKAAKIAGYSDSSNDVLRQQATQNLAKPHIAFAVAKECERIDYTADRVKQRLDRLSHASEEASQFGVAVRAEELIGKAAGMWVDQSINITANLSGDHLQALLGVAQNRATQPLELEDRTKEERKALFDDD